MIKSLKIIKKQILLLGVLCIFLSIGLIIHGIFFDLDLTQIKRLTLAGIITTFFVIFPLLLLIEWIFDMNNKKQFDTLNKKINKLQKSKNLNNKKIKK